MFGKKAKEIKRLNAVIEEYGKALNMQADAAKQHDDGLYAQIASLERANADKDQKLANAQALIQRAEADRDMQKRRADENYALYDKEKARADSLVVPFTAAVQAEAANVQGLSNVKAPDTQREVPRPKKPKRG